MDMLKIADSPVRGQKKPVILFHSIPAIGKHGAGTRVSRPRALKLGKLEIPWKDLREAPNRKARRSAKRVERAAKREWARKRDRQWMLIKGHWIPKTTDARPLHLQSPQSSRSAQRMALARRIARSAGSGS